MEIILSQALGLLHPFLLSPVINADIVQAYMGPGAGLGMIGTLIAISIAGLVVVLGLLIYPLRLLVKNMRRKSKSEEK